MTNRIGHHLGHYRLTRLLGQGGFAEVYLGEHVHLGTQAALKLLHAPLAQAEQVEAFRQEARRIAQLSHPQIVWVLDFGFALSGAGVCPWREPAPAPSRRHLGAAGDGPHVSRPDRGGGAIRP